MQTQLTQRIMRVVQHLHLLIPSVRSSALRPEEEVLRGKLEEIEEEMRRGRVKGRLNELWALIGAVGAGVEKAGGSSGGGGAAGEWAVVDEDGLAQIAQILAEQQAGLQHLTKILQKDLRDLNVVVGNSSANVTQDEGGGGSVQEGGDNMWGSSSSMLRASALR
jgi:nuclear pore complex protein Nup54